MTTKEKDEVGLHQVPELNLSTGAAFLEEVRMQRDAVEVQARVPTLEGAQMRAEGCEGDDAIRAGLGLVGEVIVGTEQTSGRSEPIMFQQNSDGVEEKFRDKELKIVEIPLSPRRYMSRSFNVGQQSLEKSVKERRRLILRPVSRHGDHEFDDFISIRSECLDTLEYGLVEWFFRRSNTELLKRRGELGEVLTRSPAARAVYYCGSRRALADGEPLSEVRSRVRRTSGMRARPRVQASYGRACRTPIAGVAQILGKVPLVREIDVDP